MIKIIDNFFEKILFQNVRNHVVNKLYYEPRYLTNKEKNKENITEVDLFY